MDRDQSQFKGWRTRPDKDRPRIFIVKEKKPVW